MEHDHRRQHDVDQNVVDRNDDGGVDSKCFNWQNLAEGISDESAASSAGCDSHSLGSLPEGVSQPLSQTSLELLNVLTLSPGIDDDKNIVTSNTKNDEHHKVVDRDEEADSKHVLVDELSDWEREQDHQNRKTRQKKRLQVNQEIKEHESDRSSGPVGVLQDLLLQLVVLDLVRENVGVVLSLRTGTLGDQIGDRQLELSHDLPLLLLTVSGIVVSNTVEMDRRTKS